MLRAVIPWLTPGADEPFPPVSRALRDPDGLLAAGGDLEPARLLRAYRHGIFPWYSAGEPILWWSPDPRTILRPAALHVSRSLQRTLRRPGWLIRFDHDFPAVMRACARPRAGQPGTWIDAAMIQAYTALHAHGAAHSVEVWEDQALVGGLYGVAIGRIFFGESMFSLRADASKVALVHLCRLLSGSGYALIDCQIDNPHLQRMGAVPMAREDFMRELECHINRPSLEGSWRDLPPPGPGGHA